GLRLLKANRAFLRVRSAVTHAKRAPLSEVRWSTLPAAEKPVKRHASGSIYYFTIDERRWKAYLTPRAAPLQLSQFFWEMRAWWKMVGYLAFTPSM
ncbi:MAG: hypothetical protein RR862_03950, partial [Eggerthellaceae bacterium]